MLRGQLRGRYFSCVDINFFQFVEAHAGGLHAGCAQADGVHAGSDHAGGVKATGVTRDGVPARWVLAVVACRINFCSIKILWHVISETAGSCLSVMKLI